MHLSICALLACGGEDAMEPSDAVLPTPTPPTFTVVGHGNLTTGTSDVWVHGTVAYTGTFGGNTLWVWDVSNPATPVRGASVVVDAGNVNDVKIRADGTLGVITHEGSQDGRNGITLLDLSDPLRPQVITRFTSQLTAGVHNVWIEGDYVYVVVDSTSGLRVLDISNPADPQIVANFYAGSSNAHDVYVRDGLAFVSHWDAGLVILDVGKGIAGGTPTNPAEVSRILTLGGNTHNAWYWPDGGYVFVGEESIAGVVHVVNVSDLFNPVEVATFGVGGDTAHNFWLDEARGILYVAWYSRGLRAIDVSGELLGRLDTQGREVGAIEYTEFTNSWAPQLHDGLVYVSDMNSGLWILRPLF